MGPSDGADQVGIVGMTAQDPAFACILPSVAELRGQGRASVDLMGDLR